MRTRTLPTTRTRSPRRAALALGAGVLLVTTGLAAGGAGAAPLAPTAPTIAGDLVVTPSTRVTTTTTALPPRPPRDLCRLSPRYCPPPTDPCVERPKTAEPPVVRREVDGEVTGRTLGTRPVPTTTTKPCPPPVTRPRPPVVVDPPVRHTPTFTG
jgi:hypothetical protein